MFRPAKVFVKRRSEIRAHIEERTDELVESGMAKGRGCSAG
jgi:hypothetical protein